MRLPVREWTRVISAPTVFIVDHFHDHHCCSAVPCPTTSHFNSLEDARNKRKRLFTNEGYIVLLRYWKSLWEREGLKLCHNKVFLCNLQQNKWAFSLSSCLGYPPEVRPDPPRGFLAQTHWRTDPCPPMSQWHIQWNSSFWFIQFQNLHTIYTL